MSEGKILYCIKDGVCFLKLAGDIRYTNNTGFEEFIEKLFLHEPPTSVLVDLSDTTSIDSTNLGLLARIARHTMDYSNRPPTLVSTNQDITTLLLSIGFDDVFDLVTTSDAHSAGPGRLESVPAAEVSSSQQVASILSAHRELVALNETNRDVFQNIIDALEADLRRHEGNTP